jgi:dTDP-4-dehydrorhamnose reductase
VKLLTINCGIGTLDSELALAASKQKPKLEAFTSLNVNLVAFNKPALKNTLSQTVADVIVIIPNRFDEGVLFWNSNFHELVKEVAKSAETFSGRVALVSSVKVLGDAATRTEITREMPMGSYGVYLKQAEEMIASTTPRHYIFRLPHTIEDPEVLDWLDRDYMDWLNRDYHDTAAVNFAQHENQLFTIARLDELAKIILLRVDSGWYGRYHLSPNDCVQLFDLVDRQWDGQRVPDRSLLSSYTWGLTPSGIVWNQLVEAMRIARY